MQGELAERHVKRLEFWAGLLEQAKTKTPNFANRSPSKDNWISGGSGKAGFTYAYVIRMDDSQVEMYIDFGNAETNKRIFDKVFAQKEQIEITFGKPLIWQRLDNKQGCRVCYVFEDGGLLDKEMWPTIQSRMIDGMVELQKVFQPVITQV